jgi:retinoid hydroxylase
MSVVTTLLLAGYQWELVPDQDLTFQMIPMPRPRSGIQVTFVRRQDQVADRRG